MLKRFILLIISISSCFSLRAEGEELSVGVTDSPPFIIIEDGEISGLTIELWDNISDSLKMKYHFVRTKYDNVATNISEGEINISIAPMAVSSGQASSTFFSQPFYITTMCVAVENHYESGFVTIVKNLFSLSFLKTIGLLLFINFGIGALIWLAERNENPAFSDKLNGIIDGFWWSWVTMTTVTPRSFLIARIRLSRFAAARGSSPAEGSSKKSSLGSRARARASPARFRIPPESSPGIKLPKSARSTSSSFF